MKSVPSFTRPICPCVFIALFLLPLACFGQTLLPQIADGGNWRTVVVLVNSTTSPATATLDFNQDTSAGATLPWVPPFLEISSPNDLQNFSIPAGATVSFHTPGKQPLLTQGWGRLTGSSGVLAYAIYTYLGNGGRPDQDGTSEGVSAATRILVPFDNVAGNVTSLAIVNPNSFAENVLVNIQTSDGSISQAQLPSLPANGQMAFLSGSLLAAAAGQRGLAEFYVTSGTISIASFRFNPTIAFTSSPVFLAAGAPIIGSTSTAPPAFLSLALTTLYAPLNAPTGSLIVIVTPNIDGTYAASLSGSTAFTPIGGTLIHGTSANQGQSFTFTSTSIGGASNISAGTLFFTLAQKGFSPAGGYATGTVTGSLSITLTGLSGAGSYTGVISGTYVQSFPTQ